MIEGSSDAGLGILDTIDNCDREAKAEAKGTYAGAGTYCMQLC